MKTKFSALTLALLLTTVSLPAFAGANHDHDREGPQLLRRWSNQEPSDQKPTVKAEDQKSAEGMNSASSSTTESTVKKNGRDIGSVSKPGAGLENDQPTVQKVEPRSQSLEEETPRRRPFHHAGRMGQ